MPHTSDIPQLLASALAGPSTCPFSLSFAGRKPVCTPRVTERPTEPLPCLPSVFPFTQVQMSLSILAWALRWSSGEDQFLIHGAERPGEEGVKTHRTAESQRSSPCLVRSMISILGVILDFMKKKPRLSSKGVCLMSARCCQGTTDYEKCIQKPHVISGEAMKWAWIRCVPRESFSPLILHKGSRQVEAPRPQIPDESPLACKRDGSSPPWGRRACWEGRGGAVWRSPPHQGQPAQFRGETQPSTSDRPILQRSQKNAF